MYKALISLVMILVMSASIGTGSPTEFESVVNEGVATDMPGTGMFAMSFAHADQWQLGIAKDGGEHCDF